MPTKVHLVKAMVFFSSYARIWELDHKEGWAPKDWYFATVVLEKTPQSPLDCKEIKPVHPKGNQSWIFIGRTDADSETPILCPPDVKNWLMKKTLMLRKIEGGRRRGRQRMRWWDGITDSRYMSLSELREMVEDIPCLSLLPSIGRQRVRHDWATEQQCSDFHFLQWPTLLRFQKLK